MNQLLTTILAIWGAVISTILLILKFIERKKRLNALIDLKTISYETEEGDQTIKKIQVKVLNKTNYSISIQDIEFIAYRYFIIYPLNCEVIPFLSEEDIRITLFKPGESKIYDYDMSYIHPDGCRNLDLLRDFKFKNKRIRARILYPDNSINHSKNRIVISSILTN
jgi:hypothetical protein